MNNLHSLYNESFFYRRKNLLWRAPILCDIIKRVFPNMISVIDVGCAIGEFVQEFQNMGMVAMGIEGSTSAKKYFLPDIHVSLWDMRQMLPPSKVNFYDLCMCLEVAEHIEEEYSDIFVNNLCSLSKTVLISAAVPGQQGHGHFNCQPNEYWEIKFGIRKYKRNCDKENQFRQLLEKYKTKKGLNAYYSNTMIYEKKIGF